MGNGVIGGGAKKQLDERDYKRMTVKGRGCKDGPAERVRKGEFFFITHDMYYIFISVS